jgi:outer membrane receptor protein involved in Fe transport
MQETGRTARLVGWVAWALVALSAAPAATPAAAQAVGRIEGTVLTGDAVPLEGAQVVVLDGQLVVHTDARGAFRIEGVPAGAATLRVERIGYRPLERAVTVPAGGTARLALALAEQPVELAGVVVSVTREPQRLNESTATVGILSGRELQATKPTHPAEVMSHIPGVWVSVTAGEGHTTSIRMPKTTDPVYLYLEDGIPTRSTGFFNHNALYEVNVPQARSIEVLKGPASALYGSDAIGGVIDVETRAPSTQPSAEAFVEGGKFGYGRVLLSGSGTRGSDGVRADLNLSRTGGWRDGTGFDRQSATARWDHYLANGAKLKTVLTGSRIDQQTAGSSTLLRDDYLMDPTLNYTPISLRNVRALRLSSAYEQQSGATLLSVTPYVRWNEMELLPNWSLTYDPTIYTTGNSSAGVVARVRREFEPWSARVIAGVDADYSPGGHEEHQILPTRTGQVFTSYTIGDLLYDFDVKYRVVSPYVQAEASPLERLHLSAGLRYDHMGFVYDSRLEPVQTGRWRRPADTEISYDHLSPKLGAALEIGEALNLYANLNQGFRTPSEAQLFRQGPAANTVGLRPITASSGEVGARGQLLGRFGYSVAAYRMAVENDILTYIQPDGTRETQNAGETLHRGIELGVGGAVTPSLRADFSYAYARHTYRRWSPARGVDYAGNEQESAPRTLLDVRLAWTPGFLDDGRLALEWNRIGGYWMDAANTHRYGGHDLVNLHANVPVTERLELVGRMLNVLDRRFAESALYTEARGEEYAPGLPRTVYVGAQYRLGR